jgi:hypothetical protein
VLLELFLRVELLAAVTALERFHLLLLVGYFVFGVGISSLALTAHYRATHMPSAGPCWKGSKLRGALDEAPAPPWSRERFYTLLLLRPSGFTV